MQNNLGNYAPFEQDDESQKFKPRPQTQQQQRQPQMQMNMQKNRRPEEMTYMIVETSGRKFKPEEMTRMLVESSGGSRYNTNTYDSTLSSNEYEHIISKLKNRVNKKDRDIYTNVRQIFMLVFVWFCAYTHKTIQKLT